MLWNDTSAINKIKKHYTATTKGYSAWKTSSQRIPPPFFKWSLNAHQCISSQFLLNYIVLCMWLKLSNVGVELWKIQMNLATEQYFPVFIILYRVVLTFESSYEYLKCEDLNINCDRTRGMHMSTVHFSSVAVFLLLDSSHYLMKHQFHFLNICAFIVPSNAFHFLLGTDNFANIIHNN